MNWLNNFEIVAKGGLAIYTLICVGISTVVITYHGGLLLVKSIKNLWYKFF